MSIPGVHANAPQARFDQALAMLHTFSFPEATKTFALFSRSDAPWHAYWRRGAALHAESKKCNNH
jgi:hypothetical protein